jgi:hypothetical protein
MRVNRASSGCHFAGFGAALGGERRVFRGEAHIIVANDDAVEIALVLNVDHFTGMDVVSDELAVEDGDIGVGRVPDVAIEARHAGRREDFDSWRGRRPKGLAADDDRRVAGLQGPKDGTERRFAVSVGADDEAPAAKLGVTRRRRIAEAADILDRYEFGQHRLVPRDRFASETGRPGSHD